MNGKVNVSHRVGFYVFSVKSLVIIPKDERQKKVPKEVYTIQNKRTRTKWCGERCKEEKVREPGAEPSARATGSYHCWAFRWGKSSHRYCSVCTRVVRRHIKSSLFFSSRRESVKRVNQEVGLSEQGRQAVEHRSHAVAARTV